MKKKLSSTTTTTKTMQAGCTSSKASFKLKKGPWTAEEDELLRRYILSQQNENGKVGGWRTVPQRAGLLRCGKSCRLRWMNYLRPDLRRGLFSYDEEDLILRLHRLLGNRWALIAGRIPGRTDNEIKNYWNTHLSKKLLSNGIDPLTHKPLISPPPPTTTIAASATPTSTTTTTTTPIIHLDIPTEATIHANPNHSSYYMNNTPFPSPNYITTATTTTDDVLVTSNTTVLDHQHNQLEYQHHDKDYTINEWYTNEGDDDCNNNIIIDDVDHGVFSSFLDSLIDYDDMSQPTFIHDNEHEDSAVVCVQPAFDTTPVSPMPNAAPAAAARAGSDDDNDIFIDVPSPRFDNHDVEAVPPTVSATNKFQSKIIG